MPQTSSLHNPHTSSSPSLPKSSLLTLASLARFFVAATKSKAKLCPSSIFLFVASLLHPPVHFPVPHDAATPCKVWAELCSRTTPVW